MIRKIVDYQKLNNEILDLLVEKYPDGYGDTDIITFKNLKGEIIEAVEVQTENTIYLVKIGKRLVQAMENFSDDNRDFDNETPDAFDGEDQDEIE